MSHMDWTLACIDRACLCVGAAWLAALSPAHAADPLAPGHVAVVESCAGGQPITLGIAEPRALLDEGDRQQVHAAMLARYPVLGRDGFAPLQIVLWRRADFEWLYVSIGAHRDKPGELCFTATFAAGVFELSPALRQKYFFAGAAQI
jgi:hypothetical protein